MAQQVQIAPEVEIGVQHVRNPRLDESQETNDVTGGILDLGLVMRRKTQTRSLYLLPRVEITRYSGDDDEDTESYFLDFGGKVSGQRSTWGLRGNFRQRQIRLGEIADAEVEDDLQDDDIQDSGIDDEDLTGTGRLLTASTRDVWRLFPTAEFQLTQRTALRFDINHIDVSYDNQVVGETVDYTNSLFSSTLVRRLSPESNLELQLFGSRYEPDSLARETDSIGARIRYRKSISDRSTFSVDLGAQEFNIENLGVNGGDLSETSLLWGLSYIRRYERTRWRVSYAHSVTPSGSGTMVERHITRAGVTHQLRPRWSLTLAAVALDTESLASNSIANNDRDYVELETELGFKVSPSWTLEFGYDFTNQNFADIDGNADRHEVNIKWSYSRPQRKR